MAMALTLARGTSLISLALLVTACSAPPAAQQESAQTAQTAQSAAATPESPVSINAEMVAVVDHAGHELWDAETDTPTTETDWANIEHHAIQVAAAGTLIRVAGSGVNDREWTQSADWQKWARAMSDAGIAARTAAQGKNVEALVAANGRLVEACEACHKQFKPDLPSEGIVHTHVH
jgi:hypothetical protein